MQACSCNAANVRSSQIVVVELEPGTCTQQLTWTLYVCTARTPNTECVMLNTSNGSGSDLHCATHVPCSQLGLQQCSSGEYHVVDAVTARSKHSRSVSNK